jgi:uncharacterized protein YwqG
VEIKEILEQLAPWRDAQKRLAWKPIVEEGDRGITASKFSGVPWLAENESYPRCGDCQALMPLFLQLDLSKIPAELVGRFGNGLLQMFYCTDCGSYMPLENNKLVRIVQPSGNAQSLQPDAHPSFPAKTIVGWTQLDDYPNSQEYEELGLIFDYDFSANTIHIECPSVGLVIENLSMDDALEAEEVYTVPGDKLAGYPYWIQGIEYPYCPECNRRMEVVFQIDSEDNLPYMFGDVGCGHITQCPQHKEILTFGWACS